MAASSWGELSTSGHRCVWKSLSDCGCGWQRWASYRRAPHPVGAWIRSSGSDRKLTVRRRWRKSSADHQMCMVDRPVSMEWAESAANSVEYNTGFANMSVGPYDSFHDQIAFVIENRWLTVKRPKTSTCVAYFCVSIDPTRRPLNDHILYIYIYIYMRYSSSTGRNGVLTTVIPTGAPTGVFTLPRRTLNGWPCAWHPAASCVASNR